MPCFSQDYRYINKMQEAIRKNGNYRLLQVSSRQCILLQVFHPNNLATLLSEVVLQIFLTRKAYKGINFFTSTDRTTHRPTFHDVPGKVQSPGTSESNSPSSGDSEKHLLFLQ